MRCSYARQMKLTYVLLLFVLSCTARGYTGPELPDSQLANIYISKHHGIQIGRIIINGYVVSGISDSVNVPAGDQKIEISYRMKDEQCSLDTYYCNTSLVYGTCQGTIKTIAERDYLVTLEARYPLVIARVSPKGYFDFRNRSDEIAVGYISCNQDISYF